MGRGCAVGHRVVGGMYAVVVVGVGVVVVVVLHGAVSPDMQLWRQGSRGKPTVSDFILTCGKTRLHLFISCQAFYLFPHFFPYFPQNESLISFGETTWKIKLQAAPEQN